MPAANPELWAQIRTIAADALELPVQDREPFVREKCAGDTATVAAVLELLGFAETLKAADPAGQRFGRFSGRKIGPYQIHWPLGAGGVGEVYLATRTDNVSMRVAIEFLRPDCTHPGLVRRFQREAQILAALDHPNIVRLLDAGETDDGQPWFVMEYVEGLQINIHCRENRLPIGKRLTLFHDACIAVQYAHVHLLVHRDIKPGNILVTSDGSLKLLDFGIARLLRPELFAGSTDTAPTAVWDQPLTPAYASPEQLTGSPVTTAADIYSLGVVLFELVTGSVPFPPAKDSTWQEFVQIVRDQEPQRPSTVVSKSVSPGGSGDNATLARQLRGDIDNIILKAIEKSPQDRYLTAQEMADDISRYQHGLPVHAHPDTAGYRTSKFIRRNIPALGAVAAVVISLTAGLATTLRQKAIADRNLAQVRDVSRRAMATYDQVQQACLPAVPATRAVNSAEAALAASPGNQSLENQLATNYAALADTLRNDGQQAEASQAAQKVVDLRTRIARERPQDPEAQSNLRTALQRYSGSSAASLGFASAGAPAQQSKSASATPELALGYLQLGDVLRLSGDHASAAQAYRSSLALYEDLLKTNPSPQMRDGADQARAALRLLTAN